MISVKYAITEDDYKNYFAYMMWDAPQNNRKRRNYYLRQVITLAAFLLAFYYTGTFQRNSFIYLVIGFLVLTFILSFIGVRARYLKQAEAVTGDPANRNIFLPTELRVSENGISTLDEVAENNYKWEAFIKKEENENYYFLFITSNQALIIPKRIFADPGDKLQFSKLLSKYISFDAEFAELVKS